MRTGNLRSFCMRQYGLVFSPVLCQNYFRFSPLDIKGKCTRRWYSDVQTVRSPISRVCHIFNWIRCWSIVGVLVLMCHVIAFVWVQSHILVCIWTLLRETYTSSAELISASIAERNIQEVSHFHHPAIYISHSVCLVHTIILYTPTTRTPHVLVTSYNCLSSLIYRNSKDLVRCTKLDTLRTRVL